ncbi:MAG TPA: hypothetical protein VIP11_03250 [Gemmatimonadaceae bacterium]
MPKAASSSTSELPRGVSKPAQRALASIGVTRLAQLTRHRREELLALHGFGPKALRELERAMAELGLEFKK